MTKTYWQPRSKWQTRYKYLQTQKTGSISIICTKHPQNNRKRCTANEMEKENKQITSQELKRYKDMQRRLASLTIKGHKLKVSIPLPPCEWPGGEGLLLQGGRDGATKTHVDPAPSNVYTHRYTHIISHKHAQVHVRSHTPNGCSTTFNSGPGNSLHTISRELAS